MPTIRRRKRNEGLHLSIMKKILKWCNEKDCTHSKYKKYMVYVENIKKQYLYLDNIKHNIKSLKKRLEKEEYYLEIYNEYAKEAVEKAKKGFIE